MAYLPAQAGGSTKMCAVHVSGEFFLPDRSRRPRTRSNPSTGSYLDSFCRAAADIVAVDLAPPEHLSAFGPVVDGIAIPREPAQLMEEHGPLALFRNYGVLAAFAGSEVSLTAHGTW